MLTVHAGDDEESHRDLWITRVKHASIKSVQAIGMLLQELPMLEMRVQRESRQQRCCTDEPAGVPLASVFPQRQRILRALQSVFDSFESFEIALKVLGMQSQRMQKKLRRPSVLCATSCLKLPIACPDGARTCEQRCSSPVTTCQSTLWSKLE